MNSQLTRQPEHRVSSWAGGSTTELSIWPPVATCAARNFALRISSATVELAESTFSDFSGFTRHIMPLAGQMALWHNGEPAVQLQPYEGHTFDGSWVTRSAGACVDFNLIHAPSLRGALRVVRASESFCPPQSSHVGIYARCDGLVVTGGAADSPLDCTLNTGDFLLVRTPAGGCPGHFRLDIPGNAGAQLPPVLAVLATVEGAELAQ